MPRDLESVFAELGISQYLDSFVEQGFDTWETILDITESDLDALGVKLGHRRKLQRRIANSRGLSLATALASPARANAVDGKAESRKQEVTRPDGKEVTVVAKRKYRRHPKPDDNAPERPPSAYVLFSNKMRDDLKGRSLTFTEIAKLVGENWQSLSPSEKEPFETQALKAKEKYNSDLAEYKKTSEYRKYMQYLQDFRQKQASQNQAKDASKRLKLEPGSKMHRGSTTSGTPNSTSGTGSGSDSLAGNDGPRGRRNRMGSTASMADVQYSSAPIPVPQQQMDEPMDSPSSTHFESERSPSMHTSPRSSHGRRRRPTWSDGQPNLDGSGQQQLPSLSDMMSGVTRTSEAGFNGFVPGAQPAQPSPLQHQQPLPPPLKAELSSMNGMAPSGPMPYQRTPSEASLPIHALLSGKAAAPMQGSPDPQQPGTYYGAQQPIFDHTMSFSPPAMPANAGPGAYGVINGHRSPPALAKYPSTGSSATTDVSHGSYSSSRTSLSVHEGTSGKEMDPGLEGMNALLRAGEIVGRRE